MPRRKRKVVRMVVEVSCPAWLTSAQARKEVRTLIRHQTHWGHRQMGPWMSLDERDWYVDEHNFKVRRVVPAGSHVRGAREHLRK